MRVSTRLAPGRNVSWYLAAAVALSVLLESLRRVVVRRGHRRLYVAESGAGAPVVLVHGLGASSRYWETVVEHLEQTRRTLAVDLLGFGRSPKPDSASYDVDCHADALAPHVPAGSVVVAHSAGASIALRLATRHPDRVGGLVLIGPPSHPDADTARAQISELGTFARLTAQRSPVARALCEIMCTLRPLAAAGAPVILRDVPSRVAIDGALHTWPSYSRTLQRVVIDHNIDDDLRLVTVPVRILVGADDPVAPVADVRASLSRTGRDDIDVLVVDAEDHHLALHRPRLVADTVSDGFDPVSPSSSAPV